MREFEEEVNPSGDAQWSAAAAFEPGNFQLISLQNLLPESDIQNMSRPCLNFVVARAKQAFYQLTLRHTQMGGKHSSFQRISSIGT